MAQNCKKNQSIETIPEMREMIDIVNKSHCKYASYIQECKRKQT